MDTKSLLIQDSEKQLLNALTQFGKTESNLEEYIGILRKWLKTQYHFPEMPSYAMLRAFLIYNKFSVEATKQKLDMYYTIRPLLPEIFQNKNPKLPHMQDIRKAIYVCPLPKLTSEGYRVTMVKIIDDNPENFNVYNFLGLIYNISEIRVQEDLPLSDIVVYDCQIMKMGHILKLTPIALKKGSIVLEKVYSNRVKAIHFINPPTYIDKLLSVCKSVLSPKLADRIHVHHEANEILKYLPKETIPKDYGGDEMSLKEINDLWKKKLEEYQDRFDTLEKMKPKEDLRPRPLKNDEILGFYGNFKKLCVD